MVRIDDEVASAIHYLEASLSFWLLEQSPKKLLAFKKGDGIQIVTSLIQDGQTGNSLVYAPIFTVADEKIFACKAVKELGCNLLVVVLPDKVQEYAILSKSLKLFQETFPDKGELLLVVNPTIKETDTVSYVSVKSHLEHLRELVRAEGGEIEIAQSDQTKGGDEDFPGHDF